MVFSTDLMAQDLIRGNERNDPYVISTDVGRVDSLVNHPKERGSLDVKFLPYQNGTIYIDITVFSKEWSFDGNAASFKIDSVTITCRCRVTGGSNDRDLGNEKFQARSINIDYQMFKKIAEAKEEVVVLYSGYEYRFTDEHHAAVKKLFHEYNNRGSE
jgi:hypothetical protein